MRLCDSFLYVPYVYAVDTTRSNGIVHNFISFFFSPLLLSFYFDWPLIFICANFQTGDKTARIKISVSTTHGRHTERIRFTFESDQRPLELNETCACTRLQNVNEYAFYDVKRRNTVKLFFFPNTSVNIVYTITFERIHQGAGVNNYYGV